MQHHSTAWQSAAGNICGAAVCAHYNRDAWRVCGAARL